MYGSNSQPTKVAENWRGRFSWIGNRGGSISSDVRAKPCVPKVCQLRKTRSNSAALRSRRDRRKTLIHSILRQHGRPRATSAKDGKNGFVISRSPVQARRAAPYERPMPTGDRSPDGSRLASRGRHTDRPEGRIIRAEYVRKVLAWDRSRKLL